MTAELSTPADMFGGIPRWVIFGGVGLLALFLLGRQGSGSNTQPSNQLLIDELNQRLGDFQQILDQRQGELATPEVTPPAPAPAIIGPTVEPPSINGGYSQLYKKFPELANPAREMLTGYTPPARIPAAPEPTPTINPVRNPAREMG